MLSGDHGRLGPCPYVLSVSLAPCDPRCRLSAQACADKAPRSRLLEPVCVLVFILAFHPVALCKVQCDPFLDGQAFRADELCATDQCGWLFGKGEGTVSM